MVSSKASTQTSHDAMSKVMFRTPYLDPRTGLYATSNASGDGDLTNNSGEKVCIIVKEVFQQLAKAGARE
jgi:hypothetical protein